MEENSVQTQELLRSISDQLSELQNTVDKQNTRIGMLEKKLTEDSNNQNSEQNLENHNISSQHYKNEFTNKSEKSYNSIPTYTPQKSTSKIINRSSGTWDSSKRPLENTNENNNNIPFTDNNTLKATHSYDMESIIGGKWLVVLGIFALLIGLAFFMKFAFDNWIGPLGQILIGYFLGVVLIGISSYLRHKYKNFSDVLTGGGIGVLYLTTFAAYNIQALFDYKLAFILFAAISVFSTLLALKLDSKNLAYLSVIGGFITPVLLGEIQENQRSLLFYMILLNFGLLLLTIIKDWQILNFLGIGLTYFLIMYWLGDYYTEVRAITSLFVVSIFALIYIIPTIINQFIQKIKSNVQDLALIVLNAFLFFLYSYLIMYNSAFLKDQIEYLTIFCAFIFMVMSLSAYFYRNEDRNLSIVLFYISTFFTTISIPLIFSYELITIMFALEAMVLSLIGFGVRSNKIRISGIVVYFIALTALLCSKYGLYFFNFKLIDISDFLPKALTCTVVTYIIVYINYLERKREDYLYSMVSNTFIVLSQVISLYLISGIVYWLFDLLIIQTNETWKFTTNSLIPNGNIYNKIVYEDDLGNRSQGYRSYSINIIFIRDLCLTMLFGIYSFFLLAFASINKIKILRHLSLYIFGLIYIYIVILITYADSITTSQNALISLLLGVLSIVGISLGFVFKYKSYRIMSLILLGIVIFKVFLFDTYNLSEIYRIISYITLGIILILSGYLYVKYQDRIKEVLLD